MRCENCKTFISLDDAVLTQSYGICKKSGRAVLKSSEDCAIDEWHNRYIKRLFDTGCVTREEARNCLEAGIGEHDYDDNPEDAAGHEMSYRTPDDGEITN